MTRKIENTYIRYVIRVASLFNKNDLTDLYQREQEIELEHLFVLLWFIFDIGSVNIFLFCKQFFYETETDTGLYSFELLFCCQ